MVVCAARGAKEGAELELQFRRVCNGANRDRRPNPLRIVLACTESRYSGFIVEKHRRHGRVAGFFKRLDMAVFGAAMTKFENKLARVAELVVANRMRGDDLHAAFEAFVHPREAIVRFGTPRALLTEAPDQAVGELSPIMSSTNSPRQNITSAWS